MIVRIPRACIRFLSSKNSPGKVVRSSRLLQPSVFSGGATKQEGVCKSQKMMTDYGLVAPASTGTLILLPLLTRSLQKLVNIIDEEMTNIGGQKLMLPCLVSAGLLKKTERWDKMDAELLKLKDRKGHSYCLGPTHEEAITQMIATLPPVSRSCYPLMLYQIGVKFRDEARPKFGLMRAREFVMKDMYTFDEDEDSARDTYDLVCAAYDRIFRRLGVPFVKVRASTGAMGGNHSHEYHFLSEIGEDRLLFCSRCKAGANAEQVDESEQTWKCEGCTGPFEDGRGIEVGHAFSLGTVYSKPLEAKFLGVDGKHRPLLMNCFGIGITRLLAAGLEVTSSEDQLRWPRPVVPFAVAVVTPKKGSHEEAVSGGLAEHLANVVNSTPGFSGDVLLDDRNSWTVGRRLKDLRNVGIPYVVIAGKRSKEDVPRFELQDIYAGTHADLTHSEILDFFRSGQ